jgi:hypothetical protein
MKIYNILFLNFSVSGDEDEDGSGKHLENICDYAQFHPNIFES